MLNRWLTTALRLQTLHDALDSSVYLVNEKKNKFYNWENKPDHVCPQLYDHKEKYIAYDKRLEDEKCKYRKYCTLFWLMLIL
jgi:hypothetical protein